jgi:ribonuclease P protein component
LKKFGLSKSERIKSKKIFSLIYSAGTTLHSNSNRFKVIFVKIEDTNNPIVKVGFAVHKNAGIAVWRNRVKRLLRESYRQNKQKLIDWSNEKKMSIYLVLSANNINQKKMDKISLSDVLPDVIQLVDKIADDR